MTEAFKKKGNCYLLRIATTGSIPEASNAGMMPALIPIPVERMIPVIILLVDMYTS